jgi:hypothetical protein
MSDLLQGILSTHQASCVAGLKVPSTIIRTDCFQQAAMDEIEKIAVSGLF